MCDECEYYGWIGETKCPECGYNLALLTGAKREEIVRSSAWLGELGAALSNLDRAVIAFQDEKTIRGEWYVHEARKVILKLIETERGHSPNDPKLSDRRSGRGTCRWVERWRWSAAGAVTAEPVRCSAWLNEAASRG
jgi:hypothetical protein